MGGKVKVKVESAQEFRDAQKHANALGLSLDAAWFGGNWESNDGEAVFLGGTQHEIEKVGRTYFHLTLSGPDGDEIVPCAPARGDSYNSAGYISLTFTG